MKKALIYRAYIEILYFVLLYLTIFYFRFWCRTTDSNSNLHKFLTGLYLTTGFVCVKSWVRAHVAKLVDAPASGAGAFTGVLVRVQSWAPYLYAYIRNIKRRGPHSPKS